MCREIRNSSRFAPAILPAKKSWLPHTCSRVAERTIESNMTTSRSLWKAVRGFQLLFLLRLMRLMRPLRLATANPIRSALHRSCFNRRRNQFVEALFEASGVIAVFLQRRSASYYSVLALLPSSSTGAKTMCLWQIGIKSQLVGLLAA